MTARAAAALVEPRWELFAHEADVGVRGIGSSKEAAFAAAGLALTATITDPAKVRASTAVPIAVDGPDDGLLLLALLDALIYEIATRRMLFSEVEVTITGSRLAARAWGEPIDIARHQPAAEVKGATFAELVVGRRPDGRWIAQCVVDV